MYPYEIFLGLDLYTILLLLACISSFIFLRIVSNRIGMKDKVYNISIACGVVAIITGYGLSVVAQAFYNYLSNGVFKISQSTGATFYGGLLGGAAIFIGLYFILGKIFCKEGEHKKQFLLLTDAAAASIAIAHSIGRIGCFFAGCCYGIETDSWLGVKFPDLPNKVYPTQLFESAFLLALFIFLTIRLLKKKTYNMAAYMVFYGIWRFLIEYLRGDSRGASPIPFLTPSQFTAVIVIAGGILVFFVTRYFTKKREAEAAGTCDDKTCDEETCDTEEKDPEEADDR